MAIKRKVQKTLPQLIEWAQDNIKEATKKVYRVNENEVIGDHVRFTEVYSDLQVRLHGYIPFDTTFTVEVEEVVDSDTVLDNIYTVNVEAGTSHTTYYKSKSINDVKTDEINIVYTIFQEEAIVLWDSQGGFR